MALLQRPTTILLGSAFSLAWVAACQAQPYTPTKFESEDHAFRLEAVTGGLDQPWGMAFLSDGRVLVTEKSGGLRVVNNGVLQEELIAGVPEVWDSGQGGLLDVAIHPNFDDNQTLYLSYSAPTTWRGSTTQVARADLNGNALENVEVIYTSEPRSFTSRHFGSRMIFDNDGYLYVTTGDRGEIERSQELDDLAGTIVRLHDDGTVPEDNPFVGVDGARPEIFAYGVRNPQGLTLHPETGAVWEHEHGPRGGDEVNLIEAGNNYGWPEVTYGIDYSGIPISSETEAPGITPPLYYWDPSIAPSGMTFYSGSDFPEWQGDLFVGALKYQLIARLDIEDGQVVGEERLIEGEIGRIRDVKQGPDGFIYILTDSSDGGLYRIVPAPEA